jgi:hypothetical protein
MKKNFITGLAVIISFLTLPGCENDENKDWTKEVMLTVSSEMVKYCPIESNGLAVEGMNIKEDDVSYWTPVSLNEIDGFHYEAGYEYRLKVLKKHLENPPADASDVTYELLEILLKKEVSGKTK